LRPGAAQTHPHARVSRAALHENAQASPRAAPGCQRPIGCAVLVLGAILLTAIFASISNALARLLRQRESVIGANQFLVLPLTFLSAAFMPLALAPDWIVAAAQFNPVNWAVEAGREALVAGPDVGFVAIRLAGRAIVAVLAATMATQPSARTSDLPESEELAAGERHETFTVWVRIVQSSATHEEPMAGMPH